MCIIRRREQLWSARLLSSSVQVFRHWGPLQPWATLCSAGTSTTRHHRTVRVVTTFNLHLHFHACFAARPGRVTPLAARLSNRTERRAVSLHTRHWLAMRSAVFVVSLEHSVLHIDRQSTLSLLLARLKSQLYALIADVSPSVVCSLSRKRKHGCAPAFYCSINSSYYYCFHYCLILLYYRNCGACT